jgi:3-dehydroquinate synthase
VAAAAISLNRGLLTQEQYKEIREGCQAFGLPLFVEGLNAQEVLAATRKDKKMDQGHIKFILMDGIGRSFVDRTVSDEELLKGIREILR